MREDEPTIPDEAEHLRALERAAERHARDGHLLKAIAACKRILLADPDHAGTRERVEALCARLRGGAAFRDPRVRERVALADNAPLDELVLERVLPAPPIALDEDLSAQPMVEIELDWKETACAETPEARRLAADTLPHTPLFSCLDAESLRGLVQGTRLVELPAGHTLFRQGDPGDALYVVAEGAVVPIAEGEPRKKLAVLEEGDFFGEIGLVTERPRSATIEALVDTKLLAVDRALVSSLVAERPQVLEVLLGYLRGRLVDRLVRTSSFFTALPSADRDALARRFRFVEMAAGAILVQQGQPSPALFALLAGEVDVIISDGMGDKRVATLGTGDVFGEMSMLTDDPAVASCVARGKCWVMTLPRSDFRALLAVAPAVREATEELAAGRRSDNERLLVDIPYLDGQLDFV